MPAYLIVNIDVHDPDKFEEYKKTASPITAAYGGKYLARGGVSETLEGDWVGRRMVLIEFESMERAREWWSSKEYGRVKGLRHQSSETQMILVEGIE
jgi:uncharacterized protein (DUF1330 family)